MQRFDPSEEVELHCDGIVGTPRLYVESEQGHERAVGLRRGLGGRQAREPDVPVNLPGRHLVMPRAAIEDQSAVAVRDESRTGCCRRSAWIVTAG